MTKSKYRSNKYKNLPSLISASELTQLTDSTTYYPGQISIAYETIPEYNLPHQSTIHDSNNRNKYITLYTSPLYT